MQASINLGGKARTVQIDHAIAYDYELATGRALHLDLPDLASGKSLVKMVDLLYVALTVPIRESGGVVDFTPRQVAMWVAESPDAGEKFGRILTDAFAVPGAESDDEGEKKTTAAARATTGK